MNTRPDERLLYRELARQGARVERSVQPEGLARIAEIAPGRGPLHVEMQFSLDQDDRPWVTGSAELTVEATCQRCLENLERPLRAVFELCIVQDPALASTLASEVDVLVAEGNAVTVADVVEDELLLALPDRLCVEEPCPHAPRLAYPAEEAAEVEPAENPFNILSELKR